MTTEILITCEIMNTYVALCAVETPSIIQKPESEVKAAEDHSISLTCRADGSPLPLITWQINATNITNGTNVILHATGDLEIKV
jgi:Immunoglobulin domain